MKFGRNYCLVIVSDENIPQLATTEIARKASYSNYGWLLVYVTIYGSLKSVSFKFCKKEKVRIIL